MAVDVAAAFPPAREVYESAREIVDTDFLAICRDGPDEVLNSTRVSQPAIFLHSMAVLAVLSSESIGADRFPGDVAAKGTAGLSLGEYSALVFAGSLRFEDALRVVVHRGEYMQAACDERPGGMASVLGLDAARVEKVLADLKSDSPDLCIGIANYNSPDQTVVSGELVAVERALERLKKAGARRAIPLRVAGAYHSALMAPATIALTPLVEALTIRPPRLPFYSNTTGCLATDPEEIRRGLIRQIESTVRWDAIMKSMVESGIEAAYELGPGTVLKGLMKSIAPRTPVVPLGTAASLHERIVCR